jgi:hypothetical protein
VLRLLPLVVWLVPFLCGRCAALQLNAGVGGLATAVSQNAGPAVQGLPPVLVADLACLQQDVSLCQPAAVTCAQLFCTAGSVLLGQWQCAAGRVVPANLLHLQLVCACA